MNVLVLLLVLVLALVFPAVEPIVAVAVVVVEFGVASCMFASNLCWGRVAG